ncbi:phosphatidylinositol transfer protein csr1 [Coemansia sp. RSA 2671]|nr:phosphatidylinositol transfer protein csr1 [Coemansia sp. RSA 2675]KAJ2350589.1 phosphatidylinositol transfer protein csr1 [Coemansia sp. RSA 2671]KAJ2696036.1 phosphatidylinositol transfer protein csr1 [Coemansia sp. IMI 209128]
MTVSNTPDLQESYKAQTRIVVGTVGNLTADQELALKELWVKILTHIESTATTPIKVTNDQVRADGLTAAGIALDQPSAVAQWYADNKSTVTDIKHQTVGDKLYLDGQHLTPAPFRPLFGDDPGSRHFGNTFWKACTLHSNPDSYLLTFLRATSWNVSVAFDRIVHSVTWRASQAIDKLMWDGELAQNNRLMEAGLCINVGRDRLDYPVMVVRVRLNVARERGEGTVERFAAYALERAAILARAHGERATLLYDFTGFKLDNIDTAFIKTLVTMINETYPQSFSATVMFVNSWLFTGIWKLVRSWLDPIVAKRSFIAKDVEQLSAFVDPSQIMSDMGGALKEQYSFGLPTGDDNALMLDVEGRRKAEDALKEAVAAFDKETGVWISGSGSYDAQSRIEAAARFSDAALGLDPYIRARFTTERRSK